MATPQCDAATSMLYGPSIFEAFFVIGAQGIPGDFIISSLAGDSKQVDDKEVYGTKE